MPVSHRSFPAEWSPQSAIMLTWPHRGTDWLPIWDEVLPVYFEIAEAILHDQNLVISCADASLLEEAVSQLKPIAQAHQTALRSYIVPADDTWARDHGPISILEDGHPKLLDFTFNAWGGKFDSSQDNHISRRLHELEAFGGIPMESLDFILEGGSIETDGAGSLLTTEHCLLTDTRNEHLDKQDIETSLKQLLGVEQVLWLSEGYLQGDDTDAHIDTLARFCPDNTICYVQCTDSNDEHYEALNKMQAQLSKLRNTAGNAYRLVPLPLPEPIMFEGRRLSATYANFLITNQSVLLPIYGVKEDSLAIEQLKTCFSDRQIVPINCVPLIKQNGSLHCISMQLLDAHQHAVVNASKEDK